VLGFGDWSGFGYGGYGNFVLKIASDQKRGDLKDAVLRWMEKDPQVLQFGWFSLLWDREDLARGNAATALPRTRFWPDLGLLAVRDSWDSGGVAALFKCAPPGGHLLNVFRNQHGDRYVNIAHDDPDANSFLIAMGDELIAETDHYSKHKSSAGQNTILVNGIGQMPPGGAEGLQWSQPGNGDMAGMAFVTAYRETPGIVAVEGEAAGSYPAFKDAKTGRSRPALERFRRTFLWVKGDYLLVFDAIKAPEPVEIDWLVQAPELQMADAAAGHFALLSKSHRCDGQVTADLPLSRQVRPSPADHRGKPLGFQQLVASAKAESLHIAGLFSPWGRKDLTVTVTDHSPSGVEIRVDGADFHDRWNWQPPASADSAATLSGVRSGSAGSGFPFTMDQADRPPAEK